MKKVIIIAGVITLLFSACSSLQKSTYSDDVYVDPIEEKKERAKIALQKKKQEEAEAKKQAEALAAQKAIDDANPAYKEPTYDKDDYYDYQYASRIRRFNNPVYGLGYYDNYYTNYYWYNQNPYYYGTSIYTSYNWWGPSFNSWGPSYGWGFGYNPWAYNTWGYNPWGYNPWGFNNWGYNNGYWNGYWHGYNNGFYNGLYGGYGYPYGNWGYFNAFDANSGYYKATYAPRKSNDGNNSARTSNPGIPEKTGYVSNYINNVVEQKESTPKFDAKIAPVYSGKNLDNGNGIVPKGYDNTPIEPRTNPYGNNNPNSNGYQPKGGNYSEGINSNPTKNPPIKSGGNNNSYEGTPSPKQQAPVKQTPKGGLFDGGGNQGGSFNKGNMGSPPSGGSSPRSGGNSGGGSHRPR